MKQPFATESMMLYVLYARVPRDDFVNAFRFIYSLFTRPPSMRHPWRFRAAVNVLFTARCLFTECKQNLSRSTMRIIHIIPCFPELTLFLKLVEKSKLAWNDSIYVCRALRRKTYFLSIQWVNSNARTGRSRKFHMEPWMATMERLRQTRKAMPECFRK